MSSDREQLLWSVKTESWLESEVEGEKVFKDNQGSHFQLHFPIRERRWKQNYKSSGKQRPSLANFSIDPGTVWDCSELCQLYRNH